MKFTKNKMISALVIAGLLLLPACSKQNSDEAYVDRENQQDQQGQQVQQNQGDFQRPAFQRPDLYGEIKSVKGSSFTLALLEMPQRRQMTDEERQKFREQRNRDNNQGGIPGNDKPANQGAGQSNPEGGKQAPGGSNNPDRPGRGFFNMEKKYTGKTETVTIPEGTPINSFQRGNREDGPQELKPSELKAGALIQVWFKKDSGDKKTIDRIRVIENRTDTKTTPQK